MRIKNHRFQIQSRFFLGRISGTTNSTLRFNDSGDRVIKTRQMPFVVWNGSDTLFIGLQLPFIWHCISYSRRWFFQHKQANNVNVIKGEEIPQNVAIKNFTGSCQDKDNNVCFSLAICMFVTIWIKESRTITKSYSI